MLLFEVRNLGLKFTAQQQAKQTPKTSQTALIIGNPEMPRGNNNQRLAALPGTQQEAYAIAELLDTTPCPRRFAETLADNLR